MNNYLPGESVLTIECNATIGAQDAMKVTTSKHYPRSSSLDARSVAKLFGITVESLAVILSVPERKLSLSKHYDANTRVALEQLLNAHNSHAEIFPYGHIAKWLRTLIADWGRPQSHTFNNTA